MGIIDLNIEKPAWNRTDVAGTDDQAAPETADPEAEPRSRLRRGARFTGGLVVAAAGVLTLTKLRNRRKGKAQSDSAEE